MNTPGTRTPFDDPDQRGVDVPPSKTTQPLPSPLQTNVSPSGALLNSLQSNAPDPAPPGLYDPPTPDTFAPAPPAYDPALYGAPGPGVPTGASLTTPPAPYVPPQPAVQQPQQPVSYGAPPVAFGAPQHAAPTIPPQPVAPQPVATVDDDATPAPKLKIPLPTLIGLCLSAGVVLSLIVPGLIRRSIPSAPIKDLPPAVAVAPPSDAAPREALPADPGTLGAEPGSAPAQLPEAAPSQGTRRPATPPRPKSAPVVVVEPGETGSLPDDRFEESAGELPGEPSTDSPAPQANAEEAEGTATDSAASSEGGSTAGGGRELAQSEPVATSSTGSRTGSSSASGGGQRYEGAAFSVAPPAGWLRSRSGTRTRWNGPRGAQLLVEVGDGSNSTPREDWERLDRSFKKKYGRRYRSLGIRDTTLSGRPAAAWEFEITSKSGVKTRKIDVALHEGGRGYAVLGSAPSARFEEMRPQIEAAINSFQLKSGSDDAEQGF